MTARLHTEKDPRQVGEPWVDPNQPPRDGIPYHVQYPDTWDSIALAHDLDVGRLIEFNFKTRNPDVVNWYLREYVGCTLVSPRANNWQFSSGITGGKGAWKEGVIYLPPDVFSFEPDLVDGLSDPILGNRLPTEEDRRAGKMFFDKIVEAAHKRAERYGQLDESTIEKILSDAADIYGTFDNVVNVAQEITNFEIIGELGSTVMLPVGSALQIVDALREIGYSNMVKEIAQRRRDYYKALAAGIASGLDPDYHAAVPRNLILAYVFRVGQSVMENASVRKKRQLMVKLIDNYYFRSHGKRPQSLQEYKDLMNGKVFYESLMNTFETHEYLWR